jgi:hypothetical protein
MNDTPTDPARLPPSVGTVHFTDAELAAAVQQAVRAAPTPDTEARLDQRANTSLASSSMHAGFPHHIAPQTRPHEGSAEPHTQK